jgi:hypothetical protein
LQEELVNKSWPADKCNFSNNARSAETIRYILSEPLCQPKGDFKPINGYRFQTNLYQTVSPTGIAVHRTWLQYSTHTNEAYCLPCWLFGAYPTPENESTAKSAWQTGFQAFKHTKQSVERHESSNSHIFATQAMKQFKSGQGIDKALAEEKRAEEKFWRKVIKRVVDVVILLGTQNLPLRGHREDIAHLFDGGENVNEKESGFNASNRGNFLAIIELLASYDTVLRDLLHTQKGKTKYINDTNNINNLIL